MINAEATYLGFFIKVNDVPIDSSLAFLITAKAGDKITLQSLSSVTITGSPNFFWEVKLRVKNSAGNSLAESKISLPKNAFDGTASDFGRELNCSFIMPAGGNQTVTAELLADDIPVGSEQFTILNSSPVVVPPPTPTPVPPETFAITATQRTGGIVTPSGTNWVQKSGSAVYTITPNAGYYIQQVYVDGQPAGAVTSYVFTGVFGSHSIDAVFTQTVVAPPSVPGPVVPTPVTPPSPTPEPVIPGTGIKWSTAGIGAAALLLIALITRRKS